MARLISLITGRYDSKNLTKEQVDEFYEMEEFVEMGIPELKERLSKIYCIKINLFNNSYL